MSQSYQALDHLIDLVIYEDLIEKRRLGHLILSKSKSFCTTFWGIGGTALKSRDQFFPGWRI
jgi:hypothetical protein